MSKAIPVMIQGTHSDAGKSVITTAFCRIYSQYGYKVAPFKSQNMSLNSYITNDGKEIGRAQGVQAEAARTDATTDMNPILIKPLSENTSQVVVNGRPLQNMKAGDYRQDFYEQGLSVIENCYRRLSAEYDRVVIEGAGSPAEINLNDRELVNMRVAKIAEAPVILVGDIDRGGVFASLVGTLQLLSEEERDRVVGVIINKFRGDVSLLQSGLDWFEKYTGKPVLGVIPFLPNLNIDAEDSVILESYSNRKGEENLIDIAVIQYPKISNFTDADPFSVEEDCNIRYVKYSHQLGNPDIVILPGSKNTIEDLQYLKKTGIAKKIQQLAKHGKKIIGICGGYQMLGELVSDPEAVEGEKRKEKGLTLLPITTVLSQEKTTVRSKGKLKLHNMFFHVEGYEIHMGNTNLTSGGFSPLINKPNNEWDGCINNNETVIGSYFHGLFHNDTFRWFLLNQTRLEKGLQPIDNRPSFNQIREEAYDKIADHVRKHVDMEKVEMLVTGFKGEFL
jgi:adenosylcobyric acid synthase